MVKLDFGDGKVSVGTCCDDQTGIEFMVAFVVNQKSQPVGERDLAAIGKTLGEISPAVIFNFYNAASAQVVIDKLVRVRDAWAACEQRIAFPEPESLTPDPGNTDCACFEKIGDNPNCRQHGRKAAGNDLQELTVALGTKQPRQNMGPAGINELALSIARDDLMQVPVARKDPTTAGIYQLAIGHRWLAAFATLETIAGLITDE
jgi:hypothetical protein